MINQLDKDYNYDNLVPIHKVRKEIGDRVSRSQFNEWMMEMQANDKIQLIGGEMKKRTPEEVDDSIQDSLGGMRYYIKRLK